MKTIKLYLAAGVPDWNGEIYREDRYIVLENGFDLIGEHMKKEEAEKIARTVFVPVRFRDGSKLQTIKF